MKLFIDGDGSPVKDVAIAVANTFGVPVVVVTSFDHYSTKDYGGKVQFIYVDQGADAADYRIVQLIQPGDLLITQDYGLAALVLPKGVRVLHHLGYEYTKESIDGLLEQRYFSGKIRKSGGHTKGPKPFTKADSETFKETLTALLSLTNEEKV